MKDISAALRALEAADKLTKAALHVPNISVIRKKLVELHESISSAQTSLIAADAEHEELSEQMIRLRARVASLETWDHEQARYNLKDFGGNTFAYELRPETAHGEPIHRICPHCFQRKHKSILQFRGRDAFLRDMAKCDACGSEFSFGPRAVVAAR
jgi:hypothetical protein